MELGLGKGSRVSGNGRPQAPSLCIVYYFPCNRAFHGSRSGPRVRSEVFLQLADRVKPGQEVLGISRVWSGRVGSGRVRGQEVVQISLVRSGRIDATPVKSPGIIMLRSINKVSDKKEVSDS